LLYPFGNTKMVMEETICAKVPAALKKKLSSLGVNTSQVIRESLQAEVDKIERERLNKQAMDVSTILKKIPPEEFSESVRATRESR
jgi:ferredoxin-fold anticodon binding domain-containing protein